MLSFNNTKIAFNSKSTKTLKQAYLLFKTLKNPAIVKIGKFLTNIALRLHLPINWAVKPTLYKQFVGGESIEQCTATIRNLAANNVKSILDYSVEAGDTDVAINLALAETLKTIDFAAESQHLPFAVFKPTAFVNSSILEKASMGNDLTEKEEQELKTFHSRILQLCERAYQKNKPILIDAEDFAYQNEIDRIALKMMEKFNKEKAIVYNTFQMYRHDRLDYLRHCHAMAKKKDFKLGAKFVRGAYMEKERQRANSLGYKDPIHLDKKGTDNAYNDALHFSITHLETIWIFCGTHNEESSLYLTKLMEESNISKSDTRVYFSQLYGMSDHLTFNLAHAGYNVAKYLPYGPVKYVLPYLLRRAEENTSVAGQAPRELGLLQKEINRRKKQKNAH